MTEFLQFTVIGVALGAVYAIAASGLVVTYATSGVFNFGHGAIGMFAAFTYWDLTQSHNLPVWLALVLVLLVEAPLLGLLFELLTRRLFGASAERALMVTIGLLLILVGAAGKIWTGNTQRVLPLYFTGKTVQLFQVSVSYHQLLVVAVAVVVGIALAVLLRSTRPGVAMRAVVDDPDLLAMAGSSPRRTAQGGWILGAFLAALAGVLIAPLATLNQTLLTLLVISAYAAAVLGRLRSLPITFLGALIIGLGEQYITAYLPTSFSATWLPNETQALPMVFLFLVVLLLPQDRLRAVGRVATQRLSPVASLPTSLLGAVVVVALGVAAAYGLGITWRATVAEGFIFGIIALSLTLLTGYAGQVSLGQFAFAGIGAFAMGKVAGGGSWLGILAAVGLSAAVGILVALPTLRVRGLFLALATLAFAEFAAVAFFANVKAFNQSNSVIVKRLGIGSLSLRGDKAEIIMLSVAFALCGILVLAVRRSTFGRRLVALADSPAASATVGLNVRATRLAVFGLSAALAGLAGALLGTWQGPVGANDLQLLFSMIILLMTVVCGVRSMAGALLAGLAYALLQTHAGTWSGVVVGGGVLLIGRLPDGLVGTLLPALSALVRRRPTEPATAAAVPVEQAHVA